jgi:mRNA interferase RelE/StbE
MNFISNGMPKKTSANSHHNYIPKLPSRSKNLLLIPIHREAQKIKGSRKDWRLRIGDYRVLYEINNVIKTITIMRIKHRREVYRDL